MAGLGELAIDLMVEGQSECCKKLHANGWRFSHCVETRVVSAEHPLGGKQSVVEVYSVVRSGFEVDELGKAIAMMLNGGNHER